MTGNRRKGLIAGSAAIGLWCFTGVCFAAGSRALGPMVYTVCICSVGLGTGVGLQAVRRMPIADLFQMPRRVWAAGCFGISVYTVLLVLAVSMADEADVAQVVLVNYLWPVFILAASLILLPRQDRVNLRRVFRIIAAGLLGFAGVALARGPEALMRPPNDLAPHAVAFGAAWLWALYCALLRRWQIPPDRNGSTAQWLVCAIVAGAVGWLRAEWTRMPGITWETALWTLGCGIGPVGLAYHWWEIGVKAGPPQTLAALSFFIPIGSALVMGLYFRASFGPFLLPGAALIVFASYAAHRAEGADNGQATVETTGSR